jgi:hypothetical protein
MTNEKRKMTRITNSVEYEETLSNDGRDDPARGRRSSSPIEQAVPETISADAGQAIISFQ